MSLEKGGRADKIGNQYENRFLAKLLIRLIEESLLSIEVEPLGDEGKGVEYIVETSDGKRIYYQCKASNSTHDKWTVADLNNLNIFDNAKKHILNDNRNEFHFISPLAYGGLDDLCDRARTNHDPQDFIKYQLTNPQLIKTFSCCEEYLELGRENSAELRELLCILSHCYFEQISNGYETIKDIESLASGCFVGKADKIRILLENCVNDNRWFGKEITAQLVSSYMENKGYPARIFDADERITPRIKILNETYWGKYLPINGEIISRQASSTVFNYIKEGYSVVLHGKAGAGKSGCAEEVINLLVNENIPYLAIKLDKNIPENSADEYGKKLGLTESPVFCLNKIAPNNTCVLILDQLDFLRWTANHSGDALQVCEEMIVQADSINRDNKGRISILFITRTFDFKNDNGIMNLFSKDSLKNPMWKDVELGLLSDEETTKIVGPIYNGLSVRLQRLLHTPSNLYVWTQLNENKQRNNIVSVNQLMEKWWEQILERCRMNRLICDDVNEVIRSIAINMGKTNMFTVPKRLFVSKINIVNQLISNGVLVENNNKISFVHQSFLDYFLATEAINEILKGKHLVDIIDDENNQTPNLRYRLLSILHGLFEIGDKLFLDECEKFIESDSIRFYYRCAVFDILAQCDNPSLAIKNFAYKYFMLENWHEYVRRVVYLGNLPFLKHLKNQKSFSWLSDDGLSLLKSINSEDPDFVVNILLTYAFKSSENNRKIYDTLCHDVFDDTEMMYTLRMKLLESDPILLGDGWFGFYNSFENSPDRCVDYLKLLIQNHDNNHIKHVHLPDENILKNFSKINAATIVSNLFPILCYVTLDIGVNINDILYGDNYSKWSNTPYSHSCLRKMVTIVSWAMKELGTKNPIFIWSLIKENDYHKSLVGNELILSALENMSLEYSDTIIEWLIEEFPLHFLDYTSNPVNFLDTGKRIIQQFSQNCSDKSFNSLEQVIISWKDDRNRMIETYRIRIENNKGKNVCPVYYSYWGHMQKELLPALDVTRLSDYAKRLIAVLNRNNWINNSHYKAGFVSSGAKSVISPINSYAEKLNDKTWLKIINTPENKMSNRYCKETKNAFIEATPYTFSSELESVAKQNPERFALLSLCFPEECYPGYISAILRALREATKVSCFVKTELVTDVIRKFWKIENSLIRRDIADLVAKLADNNWPTEVLKILKEIALTPQESSGFRENNRYITAYDLHIEAINTPRGCALNAIAKILMNHKEHGEFFKDTIDILRYDQDPSIRFAVVACANAFYNINQTFSTETFRMLLEKDLRILVAPSAWNILYQDYSKNVKFYSEKLIQAYNSGLKDLSEIAAEFICALTIFYSDEPLLEFIMTNRHTDEMVNRISIQAASTFGYEEYREISSKILLKVSKEYSVELSAINAEFFKNNIVFPRDLHFLQQLFESRSGTKVIYSFLNYISEANQDIICLADIIKIIGEHFSQKLNDYRGQKIAQHLIKCVIRLFDAGKDDPKIRVICLDIWDELFRSNLNNIKPLSDMIDNFD